MEKEGNLELKSIRRGSSRHSQDESNSNFGINLPVTGEKDFKKMVALRQISIPKNVIGFVDQEIDSKYSLKFSIILDSRQAILQAISVAIDYCFSEIAKVKPKQIDYPADDPSINSEVKTTNDILSHLNSPNNQINPSLETVISCLFLKTINADNNQEKINLTQKNVSELAAGWGDYYDPHQTLKILNKLISENPITHNDKLLILYFIKELILSDTKQEFSNQKFVELLRELLTRINASSYYTVISLPHKVNNNENKYKCNAKFVENLSLGQKKDPKFDAMFIFTKEKKIYYVDNDTDEISDQHLIINDSKKYKELKEYLRLSKEHGEKLLTVDEVELLVLNFDSIFCISRLIKHLYNVVQAMHINQLNPPAELVEVPINLNVNENKTENIAENEAKNKIHYADFDDLGVFNYSSLTNWIEKKEMSNSRKELFAKQIKDYFLWTILNIAPFDIRVTHANWANQDKKDKIVFPKIIAQFTYYVADMITIKWDKCGELMLNFWLEIAMRLSHFKCYDGVFAIMQGIGHLAINRLSEFESWEKKLSFKNNRFYTLWKEIIGPRYSHQFKLLIGENEFLMNTITSSKELSAGNQRKIDGALMAGVFNLLLRKFQYNHASHIKINNNIFFLFFKEYLPNNAVEKIVWQRSFTFNPQFLLLNNNDLVPLLKTLECYSMGYAIISTKYTKNDGKMMESVENYAWSAAVDLLKDIEKRPDDYILAYKKYKGLINNVSDENVNINMQLVTVSDNDLIHELIKIIDTACSQIKTANKGKIDEKFFSESEQKSYIIESKRIKLKLGIKTESPDLRKDSPVLNKTVSNSNYDNLESKKTTESQFI